MLGKRRRENQDKTPPRLPDALARLVSFAVTARTARRVKNTTIKVLTTCSTRTHAPRGRSPPCPPKGGRSKSPTST